MTSLYEKLLPPDAAEGPGRAVLATHCFLISRGYLPEGPVSSVPPELDAIFRQHSTACTLLYESAASGRRLTLAWTTHEDTLIICQVLEKKSDQVSHLGTFSIQSKDTKLDSVMKLIEKDVGPLIETKEEKEVRTEARGETAERQRRPQHPSVTGRDHRGNFEGMLVGPNSRLFTSPVPGSQFDPIFPDNPLGHMGGDDLHGTMPPGNLFPSRGGGRGFFG